MPTEQDNRIVHRDSDGNDYAWERVNGQERIRKVEKSDVAPTVLGVVAVALAALIGLR